MKALKLPSSLAEVLAEASEVLTRATTLRADISRRRAERQTLQEALEAAGAAAQEAAAVLGGIQDPDAMNAGEHGLAAAEDARDEAEKQLARADRRLKALEGAAGEHDASVKAVERRLARALSEARPELLAPFQAVFDDAVERLVLALSLAHGISGLTHRTIGFGRLLEDIAVPSPSRGAGHIVEGPDIRGDDDGRLLERLSSSWRTRPECAKLAEALGPLSDVLGRLRSHKDYRPPAPPTPPPRLTAEHRSQLPA